MAPISVHFALGATAAWLVSRRLDRPSDRAWSALGFVAGAVMVDADLIVSSLAFVATGSVEPGKLIHRTLTHSFLFTGALALVGLALVRAGRREWGVLALAFAASTTLLHIVPDAFYLVGVKFLFPLTLEAYHFGPLALERFSDATNNVINGLDFLSESFAWLWTWWIALRHRTENRFTRSLPWLAAVNLVLYVALTAVFATRQSYDEFLVTIYVPGIVNIVISTLLVPILARRTWLAFGRGPPSDVAPRPLAPGAGSAPKV